MRMESFRPVNRIAGYFPNMAATRTKRPPEETKLAKAILGRNIRWELHHRGIDAEKAFALMSADAVNVKHVPSAFTIEQWTKDKTAQPPHAFLVTVANFFGYDEPNSIREIDHIERRKKQLGIVDKPTAVVEPEKELPALMTTLERAVDAEDHETLQACQSLVVNTESKRLFSFVVYWMEEKFRRVRETAATD